MSDVRTSSEDYMGIQFEKSSIWIYGKGGTGIRTARVLEKAGFEVAGFIDKRAHEMATGEWLIITLQEAAEKVQDKNTAIVVICLKDVFQHEIIARDLRKFGFYQLIYKPAAFLNGGDEDSVIQRVNDIYERLVEGGYPPLMPCVIPRIYSAPVHLHDRFLIEDYGETVLAWVPIELVFNYAECFDYPKCNMPLMFGLIGLYSAFLGNLCQKEYDDALQDFYLYCGEWLHRNGISTEEKPLTGFLDSRAGVFQNLEKLAEINTGFFQQNAPTATFLDGAFYLASSGRNRVAFQIAKGYKYVPLRLAKADYTVWCDLAMVHAVERRLGEEAGRLSFAPVAHPYLVDLPCEFSDYQRLFVIAAAKEIIRDLYLQCVVVDDRGVQHVDFNCFEKLKSKLCIFEKMNDGGILRRYFQSLGIFVIGENDGDSSNADICFWKDIKSAPLGHGYCLCTDKLPEWYGSSKTGGELMFIARGLTHRYLGVKV